MALKDKIKIPHPKLPFKKSEADFKEAADAVIDLPDEVAPAVQDTKHTITEFVGELRKYERGQVTPQQLFDKFVK